MESFIEKVFSERFALRNTVLQSDHYFNHIAHGVNKLYRDGESFPSSEKLTIIKTKKKQFAFYLNENKKGNSIFVFCFKLKEKITIDDIKKLSSLNDIESVEQFLMLVPFIENIESKMDIVKIINENDQKLKNFYSNDFENFVFSKNIMRGMFFSVSYNYYSLEMAEFFTLLQERDDTPFGMYDVFKSSLASSVSDGASRVKGVISRVNAINTFAKKTYQEAYHLHRIKNDGRFLYIKSENSLIVIEVVGENVNIFYIDERLTMKQAKENDIFGNSYYNVVLKMSNGNIDFFNPSSYKTFNIYLNNVYQTLLSEKSIAPESYADQISQFDYQKNRYRQEFGDKNKFNYVADTLLNSRDNQYDAEKMCFISNSESFVEIGDIEPEIPSEKYTVKYFSNSGKMRKLNKDWLNAAQYFLDIMVNKDVSIASHYSKSEDDAKKEIVEYLKNLIEFNKK